MKNTILKKEIKEVLYKLISPSTNDSIDIEEAIDQLLALIEEELR